MRTRPKRTQPAKVQSAKAQSAKTPFSIKRLLINAFLIFHLVAITCWCVPLTTPFTTACKEFVRPYFLWSGLFQSWDMFAPSPKSVNNYLEAIVLYTDGDTRVWKFPRMEQLSFTDRYFKERFRKFGENLNDDKYSALWPDAARRIARLNNDRLNNGRKVGIRTVFLVRYWSNIVQPASSPYRESPQQEDLFYSYDVKPEDLR